MHNYSKTPNQSFMKEWTDSVMIYLTLLRIYIPQCCENEKFHKRARVQHKRQHADKVFRKKYVETLETREDVR